MKRQARQTPSPSLSASAAGLQPGNAATQAAGHFALPLAWTALAALLAGCATAPGSPPATATAAAPKPAAASTPVAPAPGAQAATPTAAVAPAPSAPAAAPPARPPAPGTPPPFAEVTKDAKSSGGFLPVWTKDDKTWLEIPATLLNQAMFFGGSVSSGIGDMPLLPGLMGEEQVVVLRRVGNSVQLVARNLQIRVPSGNTLQRTLGESFSDSLLAAVPLAAAPHPERKSLLVDASALLGGDISGYQTTLETLFRLPYALDRGNSSIERTRSTDQGTAITLRQHFAVPKLPAPPVVAPGSPPPPPGAGPNPPRGLPDPRSMFIGTTYTLAPLPATPMKPRRADPRVGYFTNGYTDLDNERGGERQTYLVQRWRLEKKDPTAEVSEPKEPVRVVLDRNIPPKWRDAVRAGVLEWNTAFERAGFRNALAVEQQPDDADWTAFEGTRLLAVRWFAMNGPGATAVGPSQADPRTGEILRGAAIIPENWVRFDRAFLNERQPVLGSGQAAGAGLGGTDGAADTPQVWRSAGGDFARRHAGCTLATEALEESRFAFELLMARESLDPMGPQADRFIADSLKWVTMHEVGHALGLRHNFKSSTPITRAQLRDPQFVEQNGTSHSVMDYVPVNLPLPGETRTDLQMKKLGAYDLWAIEYGYREFAADKEREELLRVAGRSEREPALVYGTDEDADGGDPQANRFDLGEDPVGHGQRLFKLARELWDRTQKRELAPDDDMVIYRSNLQRGFGSFNLALPLLLKQIGGTYTSRVLFSAKQPLYAPVPAQTQRRALDTVLGEVFDSNSFKFDPQFISRLGFDQVSRQGAGRYVTQTDFNLPDAVGNLHRNALNALMGDALAVRMANNENKVADPQALLSYAEVQTQLAQAVWSELKLDPKGAGPRTAEIDSLRRTLQREHVKRLAAGVVRAAPAASADLRAVHRQAATALEAELKRALARTTWSATARAHLVDSHAVLLEALRAPLVRQGA